MNDRENTQYLTLREQIKGILSEGDVHSRQAGEWNKVQSYWYVGDALISHLDGQPRADYGQEIVLKLSKHLQLSDSLLWEILRFRRSLTILPTYGELKWSHFKAVLYLPNRDQRAFYLRAANRARWSVPLLREAIRADLYGETINQPLAVPLDEDPHRPGRELRPRFGQFHVYRTIPSGNPASDEIYLDLGFHAAEPLETGSLAKPAHGLLVTPARDRRSRSVTFDVLPPKTRRHTYVAWVHRVVDGDTLIGVADLGLRRRQSWPMRLRLRGIDTPELNTLAGRNAREFVVGALSAVDFVVISSFKTDTYGRFLVDVRYLPGEDDPDAVRDQGIYLNRQLLNEHLAVRYPD